MPTHLAVLGSPISHSKSPALHAAAYRSLGLDWTYRALDVPAGGLSGFLARLDPTWRGLSLTMPHKRDVIPLLDRRSDLVDRVGAANTVLIEEGTLVGFNTDVEGIVGALAEVGVIHLDSIHILGAGATAASSLAAAAQLGARRARVWARDVERARSLTAYAEGFELDLTVEPLAALDRTDAEDASVVVSTLPGGAADELAIPEGVRRHLPLLDVAYDPWPSALAEHWSAADGTVVSGLIMLLHQAVAQVRIFVTGSEDAPLPGEADVVAAMRSAVGL